jgi:hypothetical protein
MYADMHAGRCTAGGQDCQTSGYRLPLALGKMAPAHLRTTSKLPSRSPAVDHHGDGTAAWRPIRPLGGHLLHPVVTSALAQKESPK